MSSPDYRPRPPDHPPENQEVRWGWILQGYYMGRDAEAKLAALKLDLSRLQHDLSSSIGQNIERIDELNLSLARITTGIVKVETEAKDQERRFTELLKPIEAQVTSLNLWRARWMGVWIVLALLAPILGRFLSDYIFKFFGKVP